MTKIILLASAAIGVAAFSIDVAKAQGPMDWTGFYAGVHGGYINGQITFDNGPWGDVSGFVGGVLAGRNFVRKPGSPYQWGVEGDFGWINASGNSGIQVIQPIQIDDGCYNYYSDLNWDAHLRVRVGMPVGNLMPFLAGGLAFADLRAGTNCDEYEGRGGVFVGGTVGGGVDFKLAPNLIGRGEFLYDFYGSKQYEYFSASLHAWTLRAALTWLFN